MISAIDLQKSNRSAPQRSEERPALDFDDLSPANAQKVATEWDRLVKSANSYGKLAHEVYPADCARISLFFERFNAAIFFRREVVAPSESLTGEKAWVLQNGN